VPRYPQPSRYAYTFGPGPLSSAIKALIAANVAAFVLTVFVPALTLYFGLTPAMVIEDFWLWQPVTYMVLHGGLFHILFNMLALWMFGVELERMWGTRFFLKYYFVTGIGAALTTIAVALLPFDFAARMYFAVTIGASGAIYGLLLAYALYYPDRQVYMYFLFPVRVKYFVMIIGGIALLSSISDTGGGLAHVAHLGGLVVGYLYLKRGRSGVAAELKYRYLKWKMNRLRRKFDVYSGGRHDDWSKYTH
jgi:membrane associated rhomboid family serine protease